jgi:hypothetical protein
VLGAGVLTLALGVAGLSASCNWSTKGDGSAASGSAGDSGQGTGRVGSASWVMGAGVGTFVNSGYACAGCANFPAVGAADCATSELAAPTLVYPPDGVLLPPNLNVLEVQFIPNSDATLFEVDFISQNTQVTIETPCVAVPDVRGGPSRGCGVTLPQAAWNDIANNNREAQPLKVTVRATKPGIACAKTSANSANIAFAKEDLAGGIYWQSATLGGVGGKTGIYSHDFGSFDPTPTPFYTSDSAGTCVGCHSVSPDGLRMALEIDDPDAGEIGDVHSLLMAIATRRALGGKRISPNFQTFTRDHETLSASTFNAGPAMLARGTTLGGGLAATQPDLASDDATVVFVVPKVGSISSAGDPQFRSGALYTSSFDAATGAFGTPRALLTPQGTQNLYYPSFSPDRAFVIFNAAPEGDSFFNRKARIQVIPFPNAGATAIDLPALNRAPPGAGDPDRLTNSSPKWSPFVQAYRGHRLLWVTFSSNRDYGLHLVNHGLGNCSPPESPAYDQPQPSSKPDASYENCAQPQIWMAAVIVDQDGVPSGVDRSFPAFWLPFQDVTSHNHTAQWVEKVVAPPPPPDGGSCVPLQGTCDGDAICCTDSVCCFGTCLADCTVK